MRLMLRFTIPVEKGNEAEANGTMAASIKELLERVKPEAAWFHLHEGKRAGTIIFDETDQTRMAVINEPLFAQLNAAIDIQPVVSMEELTKAL